MAEAGRSAQAGGFILALAIIAGVVIGSMLGQASKGFLIGTGAGIFMALAIWAIDRGR